MEENISKLDKLEEAAPGLMDGEDVVIPSLLEALGLLDIPKTIKFEKLVDNMFQQYRGDLKQYNTPDAPQSFVAFIIPLDTYIPLGDGYAANILQPDGEKSIGAAHLTTITSIPLSIQLQDNRVKVRLSVACVAIGNRSITNQPLLKLGDSLSQLYDIAVQCVNNVILGYKVTPNRHNHELRTITALNRPSYIKVARINGLSGEIEELEAISYHSNFFRSVLHARKLNSKELGNFQFAHVSFSRDQVFAANILQKIYEAIDARCTGDNSYSIVLADTYVEHAMRYVLFQGLLQKGYAKDSAGLVIDELRTMEKLVGKLAEVLGTNKNNLKQLIEYEEWKTKCRDLRNGIAHHFMDAKIENRGSMDALITSITLVIKLADLSIEKFPVSKNDMRWFQSLQWYLNNMDKENNRIDDIVSGLEKSDSKTQPKN